MGLYRISKVAELSGVPTATLRAWERRYGVPIPQRTSSAYRLYGDADVDAVKRMRDLIATGVSASEAASTVRATTEAPPAHEASDPFVDAAERIVDAAIRFDPEAVEMEVARALTLGAAALVYERTISPALRRVGDLWHEGQLTIAQEHITTEIIGVTLSNVLRLVQPEGAPRRAALACFEDEDHVLGLYGVGLRLASWGFRSVVLGARTPPDAIARVVTELEPDLVALSCTVAPPPPRARALVDAYADACRGAAWIVGGAGAPRLAKWVEARGGFIVPSDFRLARSVIDQATAAKRDAR